MFVKICPRHRAQLRRLCFCGRLLHPKSMRHLAAGALGFLVMSVGVTVAHEFPTLMGEIFGWSIHALGAAPILAHLEPLWLIITGE